MCMLEISQLFWFEDIFVSQMISAIVCDGPFIAGCPLSSPGQILVAHVDIIMLRSMAKRDFSLDRRSSAFSQLNWLSNRKQALA